MELFKLLGTIAIDNSDAKKALSETSAAAKQTADDLGDTSSSGEKTGGKLSGAFKKIGSGAVAFGKAAAVGIAAGATALGGLTAKALSAAGELEQNMGGSEAVFGKHAGKMQETAKSAFSNMGLSASDFLGTANKMGALFQGAGFDIETSATMSSDAMQRAADVASIMGIDTSAAMEAIAGAAKGNFTMMDNLGVAMNDTTLNAYAMSKGIDKTTQEMTNQEKIGLAMEMFMEKTAYAAGNYAKENETLAGSLGTAKSALSNFLSGAGTVEDVVSSFSNAAKVIVKNINTMFPSLMSGITQLVNQIVPMIPPLLEQLLPGLIEGATGLINGLVSALPAVVDVLTNSALPQLLSGIVTIFNSLISALPSLVQSIASALPTLIPILINGLVSMIVTICSNFSSIIQPIISYLPAIIISVVSALLQNLPILIQGAIQLVMGIVSSIGTIIETLVGCLPQVVSMIVTGLLQNLPILIQGCIQLVMGIVSNLGTILSALIRALPAALSGIWNGIKNVFGGVGDWFGEKFSAAKEKASQAWANAKEKFSNVWNNVKGAFANVGGWFKDQFAKGKENAKNAWSSAKSNFTTIKNGITNVFSNVGSWFKEKFTAAKNGAVNAWSTVKSKFTSIKNGVVNAFSNVKEKLSQPFEKARDAIKKVADKIKGFFKGEIKMPKIKLPHFGISPSGWKIGDLLDGKIPKLKIDWYAEAMKKPMIMTKPTIFGYDAANGNLMGGGEAGSEVVSGTGTLMNMIRGAVAEQNSGIAYYLQKIIELLAQFFPDMLEALDISFSVDGRELATELAPSMNEALGKIALQKGRGR